MNMLPDIPNDTYLGLNPNLSDIFRANGILGMPQMDPLQGLSGLSQLMSMQPFMGSMTMPQNGAQGAQVRGQASLLDPNTGAIMTNTSATYNGPLNTPPSYDGWTLPKGTARGVLDPLPTYQVGTGPTMASMGYTTPNAKWANPGELARMPKEYEPYVQEAARLYHMDPNFIKAMMRAESNFNPNDVSPAGAVGLMQLMPATAKDAGITDAQRWDPRMNILAGTRYIRQIYDKYQNWPLTIAAWNAGPNRRDIRSGRIPNIEETRNHVRRVMALWGMEW